MDQELRCGVMPEEPGYIEPGDPNYVGCSQVANILGLGFKTPNEQWEYHTRRVGPEDKQIFHRGHRMEPVMEELLGGLGLGVRGQQYMYYDPRRPWLICHVDGLVDDMLWEAKAPGYHRAQQLVEQGLTPDYLCQIQAGMHCTGLDKAMCGFLDYEAWELRTAVIERSDKFIQQMLERLEIYWECVKNDVPPDPPEEESPLEMPEVSGELQKIDDEELVQLARDYAKVEVAYKRAEAMRKELRRQLGVALNPYELAEVGGVIRVSYKWSNPKPRPNADRILKEARRMAHLAGQELDEVALHNGNKPSRTLRITLKEGANGVS